MNNISDFEKELKKSFPNTSIKSTSTGIEIELCQCPHNLLEKIMKSCQVNNWRVRLFHLPTKIIIEISTYEVKGDFLDPLED